MRGTPDLQCVHARYMRDACMRGVYARCMRGSPDLQGVYVSESATYMMVDPVIHSVDYSGGSFGRTDRGERGFDAFFATHQCNALCAALGIPRNERYNAEALEDGGADFASATSARFESALEGGLCVVCEDAPREVRSAVCLGETRRQGAAERPHCFTPTDGFHASIPSGHRCAFPAAATHAAAGHAPLSCASSTNRRAPSAACRSTTRHS